jgi:hypothetical protein
MATSLAFSASVARGEGLVPRSPAPLKVEGERLARDARDQEIATIKAAFGF